MLFGAVVLSSLLAGGDTPPESWQVDAGALISSPVLSRGRSAVGGVVVVTFAPFDLPLLFGVRTHWSVTDATDGRVRLEHQRVGAELLVGSFVQLGIGRIWGSAYGGPRWIHEHGAPIQSKRLSAVGISQSVDSDLVFPAFGLEAGMSITLFEGFGLGAALGPELLVLPTSDRASVEGHAGWQGRGSVTYAF